MGAPKAVRVGNDYSLGGESADMGSVTFDFRDETVLITGASSGIGRALALAFGAAGARVINADVTPEPSDADATVPTHDRIVDDGGMAAYVETDVTDPAAIERAVEVADQDGLDVMINNAGVHLESPFLEVSPEAFDRVHAINVRGTFFGCQAAGRAMLAAGGGTIVNLASISAEMAKPDQAVYESSKAAIQMLTRSAALEFAPAVRVNALAPGRTATEFGDGTAAERRASVERGELDKPIPLGRSGEPEDLVGACLLLASEGASYVTGETVFVDGGFQVI